MRNREKIGRVVPLDLNKEKLFIFDFTENNKELRKVNMNSPEEFDRFVKETLKLNCAKVGIGKYNEDRIIYKHSELFGSERRIHLGIDIILPAGTKVLAPLDGLIHSFRNNKGHGDYGPTIILQHELEGIIFFTLYGHLSEESLKDKSEGQKIKRGDVIGEIGNIYVNGGWFEHLHFQIIRDMLGKRGDFPGVANIHERDRWLALCPNPNLILKINTLDERV
jgi:hypothetical protein